MSALFMPKTMPMPACHAHAGMPCPEMGMMQLGLGIDPKSSKKIKIYTMTENTRQKVFYPYVVFFGEIYLGERVTDISPRPIRQQNDRMA